MDDYESLSHSKWECKYHVVFNSEVPQEDLTERRSGILWASTSGRGDTSYPQYDGTQR